MISDMPLSARPMETALAIPFAVVVSTIME